MIIKNIPQGAKSEDFNLAGIFYPAQFITEEERNSKAYIKKATDFFAGRAFQQLVARKNIIKNYKLRNGEFDFNDYSGENTETQLLESVLEEMPQDSYYYLRHYPIVNSPLNTMLGELIGRPKRERVKATDDISTSEILSFRTNILYQEMVSKVRAAYEGIPEEELPESYYKELSEKIMNYSTAGEKWGNKAVSAFKYYFDYQEKNEDSFMDLMTSAEEYHHFYTDKSKIGFDYKVENPINVWYLGNANARFTSDCWAVGTIKLLSISELVDKYTLDEDEIKQLTNREISMDGNPMYNIFTPSHPHPDLFNWGLNMSLETLTDATMMNAFSYGNQQYHVEVVSYFKGKKKIFKRTYLDEEGYQRTQHVDEMYKFDKNYGDISLEEEWMNQWYKCVRIGPYVYKGIEELEFNDNCPIVGIVNTTKNTKGRSLLDLMKPYQIMYNVLLNKIWEDLSKDYGVVFLGDIKLVPNKDSHDPIEQFLFNAKERGMMLLDTSIENTGGNVQFNQFTALDLSRAASIAQKINIANQIKDTCWELIGISRQRTGSTLASETATSINTSINQSYAQTEPWFKLHEDLQRRVLQTALNIMQYTQLKKPESILNYLNSDLDNSFIKITKSELLRDLFVFITSSKEDKDRLEMLKQLMQPAMQNGADLIEMMEIMSLNSENRMKDILKTVQERKDKQNKQLQDMERQKIEQGSQIAKEQMDLQRELEDKKMLNDNINKQLDREMQIEKARITSHGFDRNEESDSSNIEEATSSALERSRLAFEQQLAVKQLQQKDRELDIKEKDSENKVLIAKTNKNKNDKKK